MGKKLGLIVLVLVGVVILGAGAIAALVWWKPASVQEWVGRQIVGIANSYLVPRLDYKHVEYHAPGEVVLTGVTLTAPDGTKVLDVGTMTVVLAEVPHIGQPIAIERLALDKAVINLVRNTGKEGGFRGLSPMLKGADKRRDVPSNFKLSNVMRLKLVELKDCGVRYDQGGGAPPMVLSGITSKMDIAPAQEPGWYAIQLQGGRAPAATLNVGGRINIDSYTLDLQTGQLHTRLDPQTAQTLPPDVQNLLKQYDTAGDADINLTGTVPLMDLAKGNANASINITNFSFAAGGYRLPMQHLTMNVHLSGGALDAPDINAALLSGGLTGALRMDLSRPAPARPMQAQWRLTNLDLSQMHRDPKAAQDPKKIIGILSGDGQATMDLGAGTKSLAGGGALSIRNGRLFALPGFMDVLGLLDKALVSKVSNSTAHEADIEYRFQPQGIEITKSEVRTDLAGARATGLITYDQRLDLHVNAGPMEKLQSMLGGIGKAIGAVTDHLVGYRVQGTIKEPKVSVDVLGK